MSLTSNASLKEVMDAFEGINNLIEGKITPNIGDYSRHHYMTDKVEVTDFSGTGGNCVYFKIPDKHYIKDVSYIMATAHDLVPKNIISGKNILGVIGSASIKVTAGDYWLIHHDGTMIDAPESMSFSSVRSFTVRNVGSCRLVTEFKGGGSYASSVKPMVLRYTVKRGGQNLWTSGEFYNYAGSQFDDGWGIGTADTPHLEIGDVIHVEMKSAFVGSPSWESGPCPRRTRNFQVRGNPYL